MKKTCLIISGGDFSSCPKESYDLVIAVDKGLEYALRLNISPDVIIGDFDSLEHTGIPGSPNLSSILEQDNSAYKGRAGDMMDIELEMVNGGTDEQEPSRPETAAPGETIPIKDNPGGNGEVWNNTIP